jgi:iron-sulfur cluster repair protein YtfE (RIC family)
LQTISECPDLQTTSHNEESNIKLKGNSQSGRQKNVCINISISISEIMKQELDAMKKEHSEQLRALGNMATCISRIEGETTQKLVELKSEETKNKSGRT